MAKKVTVMVFLNGILVKMFKSLQQEVKTVTRNYGPEYEVVVLD